VDSSSNFDVVVVGGSIAGSTAATLYARKGLRVALVEARAHPDAYKTLCTHFIQPCATPAIQRLGVAEELEAAGALRNSLEMWNRWGWIRRPEGDEAAYGYSIRREKLDPILRRTAAGTPGVTYLPGRTAIGLVRDGSRVAGVEVRDQEGSVLTLSARLVVGADGRHSKVAELAGVGARKIPNKRSGYFAYYEGIPNQGGVARTWFLDPDVAYVFPNEDGVSVLACMFGRKDKLDWFRKDLAGNLRRTFERLPDGPDLSGATQISKVIGAVDLPNFWRKPAPEGLTFAGDALVSSDPLFGVGCGWAFQEAEWLVECTAPALGNGSSLTRTVDRYRKVVRKEILAHFLMTSEYSLNRRYNPAEKLLFSAGAKDPAMARLVHDFGGRVIPVGKVVSPVTMAKAAMVNLRHRGDKEQTRRNRMLAGGVMTPPDGDGLRRGTIEVAGISSPTIEAGPGEATEAIVFVHGNPGSSEDFAGLVAEAGKLTRAVAVDMPGFGRAGKPAGFDYTVEGYAAHLGKMLDHLGIQKAHLVVHDFGGPWALAWAA
jgi:menaquinone-9 beta-reductase